VVDRARRTAAATTRPQSTEGGTVARPDGLSNGAGAEEPEPTGLYAPTERRTFLGLLVAGPTVAAVAYLTRGASTAPAAAA
jgi:hypothetical protein